MVYSSGAKTLSEIIDEIADGLIGTNMWHNVDTTWNTVDRTANNARRVLAYGEAGASGRGSSTLSLDINPGDTLIPVISEANFSVGDKVVIRSGGIGEVREVTAVGTGEITVNAAVDTAHAVGEPVRELEFEIFLALEAVNSNTRMYYGNNYFGSGNYLNAKGLRIVFCATWDAVSHTYPTSNQSTFIPFEGRNNNAGVAADLAVLLKPTISGMNRQGL